MSDYKTRVAELLEITAEHAETEILCSNCFRSVPEEFCPCGYRLLPLGHARKGGRWVPPGGSVLYVLRSLRLGRVANPHLGVSRDTRADLEVEVARLLEMIQNAKSWLG